MIKTTKGNISVFKTEKFASYQEVVHFFSTREGGISNGVFKSLNFGSQHGEGMNMEKNLDLLKQSIGFVNTRFVIPRQTHTDVVAVVDESNCDEIFENTDALITNSANIVVCIKTADCVPILLLDPVRKVIGAVHAGWRGTAQNIGGKAIEKMVKIFGSNPSDIIAAIGPSISMEHYEVGPEVIDTIAPMLYKAEKALSTSDTPTGKRHLNLSEANYQLLVQAGITERNIDSTSLCTYSHPDVFFSARRDGSKTGRMINGIGIVDIK